MISTDKIPPVCDPALIHRTHCGSFRIGDSLRVGRHGFTMDEFVPEYYQFKTYNPLLGNVIVSMTLTGSGVVHRCSDQQHALSVEYLVNKDADE